MQEQFNVPHHLLGTFDPTKFVFAPSDFRKLASEIISNIVEYNEAVRRIKENMYELARKQVSKIMRLRDAGWDVRRIDATEVFKAAVTTSECGGERVAELWERLVVEPSVKMVKQFLDE
ncbi:hypothetical protein QVD17_33024 [Tagetes erecta]|uniref:Uncharacterized protein n=1 Tax=Tagetes erecta TaxID=13708 RepID=A0AAD8NDR7_TARER|nr:hypothetical protein QVD17_33024 [Tagetes erecta]